MGAHQKSKLPWLNGRNIHALSSTIANLDLQNIHSSGIVMESKYFTYIIEA